MPHRSLMASWCRPYITRIGVTYAHSVYLIRSGCRTKAILYHGRGRAGRYDLAYVIYLKKPDSALAMYTAAYPRPYYLNNIHHRRIARTRVDRYDIVSILGMRPVSGSLTCITPLLTVPTMPSLIIIYVMPVLLQTVSFACAFSTCRIRFVNLMPMSIYRVRAGNAVYLGS